MIGTVRKHQKWLWAIIIFVTIISFVVFFSPSSKLPGGGGGGDVDLGSIDGKKISREQYLNAQAEVRILHFLRFQQWPGNDELSRQMGFDLQRETYNRILLLEKIKQMDIHASVESTARLMKEILQGNADQALNQERYNNFKIEMARNGGVSASDFERFVGHEVANMHLISVIGLSGKLVTPQEAQYAYRRENESAVTEAAIFSATNFLSQVPITPAALGQFYTNNMSAYRLPEQAEVNYVKFEMTNFLAEADAQIAKLTNFNMMVDQAYLQRGTNFYKDADDKVMAPEAAKAKIKSEFRQQSALIAAKKKASDFITEAYAKLEKDKTPRDTFAKFAASKNFKVKTSSLFEREEAPAELKVPVQFGRVAFALTPEEPLATSPIEGEDGVYVIVLSKKVPSYIQPFEILTTQVTQDYKFSEARKLARTAGETFSKTAATGLAEKKSFDSIAAAAKVKPVSIPAFSSSARSIPEIEGHINLNTLHSVVSRLTAGKSSEFIATPEGGVVVYLKTRQAVEDVKMQVELPTYIKQLRESRQYAAFNDWFQKQAQELRLVTPNVSSDKPQP